MAMSLEFKIDHPQITERLRLPVRVTTEGMFTCQFPKEIAQIFIDHGVSVCFNRQNNPGFFAEDRLESLKKQVDATIRELCSEREIERANIIRYDIETACAYARADDGTFLPNPGNYEREWINGTKNIHATEPAPFGVQIYARPCVKITYERNHRSPDKPPIKRVEWRAYPDENRHNGYPENDAVWLCRIVANIPPNKFKLKEVPLTPETAGFFRRLYEAVFAMNEKIKPFVEPDGILSLANKTALPLLGIAL